MSLSQHKIKVSSNGKLVFIFCPACKALHCISIEKVGYFTWTFDGNFVSPTIDGPSIIVGITGGNYCHFFIERGFIKYCSDSFHQTSGAFDLPPVSEWNFGKIKPKKEKVLNCKARRKFKRANNVKF